MKTRLLVVDDNEDLTTLIKKYFDNSDSIEVTRIAHDGERALNVIENEPNEFDIILLDLIMPRKDGLYVLKRLKEEGIKKKIIVMSSYNEEETIREVSEYGVRYYALKPFDFEDLSKKILSLGLCEKEKSKIIDIKNKDINLTITKLLHDLGIPSHIKGYQFIRSGISMVYNNPKLIGGITKELYPDLSMEYNTSVQRVERAIRHAIEVSWLRGDIDLMEEIFGHSVDIDRAKPTNSEFIVTIADKLRLEMAEV